MGPTKLADILQCPQINNKLQLALISWRGRRCVEGSLVAVVVVVLLVVAAVVLEALVPFLVPVTNSICGNDQNTCVNVLIYIGFALLKL